MRFLKPAIALVSAVWLIAANAGIEAPRIGFVRLTDGNVWSLRGVGGNSYFGERTASRGDQMGVRTPSFGKAGLAATSNRKSFDHGGEVTL